MNWASAETWYYLLFSFEGRISRAPFWIAGIALSAVTLAVDLTALAIDGERLMAITWLASLYPTLALVTKRLHDRARPPSTLIFLFGPAFLITFSQVLELEGSEDDVSSFMMLLITMSFASAIWMFVDLGLLRGTIGPNAYGPDPLENAA